MAAKQGYISKTLKLKNKNAKYKITYSSLKYSKTTSTGSEFNYSYSKQIASASTSNLRYKEE